MSHWGKWVNDLQQNLQPVQNNFNQIVGFFINPEKKKSENIPKPPNTQVNRDYGQFIDKMQEKQNGQIPKKSEQRKKTSVQSPSTSHLDIAFYIFQPGQKLLEIKHKMRDYMYSHPNTHKCHESYMSGLYDSIMTMEAKRLLTAESPIEMVGNTITPSIIDTKNDLDNFIRQYNYSYLPYHKDPYPDGNRTKKNANWYLIFSKHGNTILDIEKFIQIHSTNIFGKRSIHNQSYDNFIQKLREYKQSMITNVGYFLRMFKKSLVHYDLLMHTLMMKLLDCSYDAQLESICYSLKSDLDNYIISFNRVRRCPRELSYTLPSNTDPDKREWKHAHWITLIRLDVADVAVFRAKAPSKKESQKEKKKKIK